MSSMGPALSRLKLILPSRTTGSSRSQALPIGGQTSADVSNRFPTFFTPANYAFAIWGVIYALLLAFGVYQALPSQRDNRDARAVRAPVIATCILNCLWITLFQFTLLLPSVIVIVAFLIALIVIYRRLDVGRSNMRALDRWFIHLPFSVYLGWLCVATIANVALFGVASRWGDLFGVPAPVWSAIMIAVATVLGLIFATTRRDVGYVLVLIWAFVAIVNKQADTAIVSTTASIAAVLLAVVLAASLVRGRSTTRLSASTR